MKWKQIGAGLDAHIGDISERATRKMTRRSALRTAVVGGVAGMGALALGQAPAFGAVEKCTKGMDCGPTRRCSGCGGGSSGCPSGYHLCKSSGSCAPGKNPNKQGFFCEWPGGSWIACQGAGKFGHGYYLCLDCVDQGCSGWCTCISSCICCNCTTAAELRNEQKRLNALSAS